MIPPGPASAEPRAGGTEPLLVALRDEQRQLAEDLVGLASVPISRIREALLGAEEAILGDHLPRWEAALRAADGPLPRGVDPRLLRAEHARFVDSLAELGELIAVVERDPHGGNRQALGQYWRLLVEALDRHVADEEELLRAASADGARPVERARPPPVGRAP
jgi:Hemerythrin HHE cation binding domain